MYNTPTRTLNLGEKLRYQLALLLLMIFSQHVQSFASGTAACDDFNMSLTDINHSQEYRYTREYLSKWIESSSLNSPRATVLLVHGLNLKPSKMDSIGHLLSESGANVLRVSLSGHRGDQNEAKRVTRKIWLNDIWKHYCLAQSKATQTDTPLYVVAYSLGGLLVTDFLANQPRGRVTFEKQILIAPAITPYWYAKMPAKMKFLPNSMMIPSKNLKSYRVHRGTSVASYRALAKSVEKLQKSRLKSTNIPTLVMLSPRDELVSIDAMRELVKRSGLTKWRFETVENISSELEKSYYHLIIDKKSLGQKRWETQKSLIKTHLDL